MRDGINVDIKEQAYQILEDGMLTYLSPREEFVVRARFGFNVPPKTRSAIADRLSLSSSRIQQIEARALGKLYRRLLSKLKQIDGVDVHRREGKDLPPNDTKTVQQNEHHYVGWPRPAPDRAICVGQHVFINECDIAKLNDYQRSFLSAICCRDGIVKLERHTAA